MSSWFSVARPRCRLVNPRYATTHSRFTRSESFTILSLVHIDRRNTEIRDPHFLGNSIRDIRHLPGKDHCQHR